MLNFAPYIDLPLIWGGLIAAAIFLYVLLDGFDLGVGILFPFAPSESCRNKMVNSIAPFWDGNETWLVLGGGGLFAAFPLAYSILMPALYLPVILMLLGLIFRGVAFEFRFKAERARSLWDYIFHFGSLVAAFFQGVMLGTLIQGVTVVNNVYAGNGLEWLSPFSLMTGLAVVFGYGLLGSTWLIIKTTGQTQSWARDASCYLLMYVLLFLGLVSLWAPFINDQISSRWFSMPNLAYLSPIPMITAATAALLFRGLYTKHETSPFLLTVALFALGYGGLAISIWPWVVPYQISVWQGAAAAEPLSLMLVGAVIMLPVILGYTAYCYYLFWGKASDQATH